MFYLRDPKTLVTVVVASTIAFILDPVGKIASNLFAGLLIPVLDGVLWGKERWDQTPTFYAIFGVIYVAVQVLIGREHRVLGGIFFGIGLVLMQSFLFHMGKNNKNA